MQNNKKKGVLQDIGIVVGIVALLLFMFRLWPLLIIALPVWLGIVIYRSFTAHKRANMNVAPTQTETVSTPQVQDRDWYSTLIADITEYIQAEYPDVRWIWQYQNSKQRIEKGEEIIILLNKAGGYRKARVQVRNYWLESIEYLIAPQPQQSQERVEEMQEIPVNYSLLACEWVEERTDWLNERCNEAIGQGRTEVILTEKDLPSEKESWADVCAELITMGFSGAEQIPEGIKITVAVAGTERE